LAGAVISAVAALVGWTIATLTPIIAGLKAAAVDVASASWAWSVNTGFPATAAFVRSVAVVIAAVVAGAWHEATTFAVDVALPAANHLAGIILDTTHQFVVTVLAPFCAQIVPFVQLNILAPLSAALAFTVAKVVSLWNLGLQNGDKLAADALGAIASVVGPILGQIGPVISGLLTPVCGAAQACLLKVAAGLKLALLKIANILSISVVTETVVKGG
jgi:hypothetical protein